MSNMLSQVHMFCFKEIYCSIGEWYTAYSPGSDSKQVIWSKASKEGLHWMPRALTELICAMQLTCATRWLTALLQARRMSLVKTNGVHCKQRRTQKIFMGGFIQWHMVVISIWYALFVMSQFDVIFMFPNQRFGEVCWHNMRILLQYTHSPYFMCHCTEYKPSALQARISEENTLNAKTKQFITAYISDCALKQGIKQSHHCVRTIYNCKITLR